MKRWFSPFIDRRLVLLTLPALAALATDLPVLISLVYSISAVLFIVAVSHWMRQVILHYVDMSELMGKAKESSLGSALIYLATTIYMSVLVICAIWWVRG